jgi:predicted nuclease with TOPRIM domain
MALVTHTVSINPAFLREIKEDHHELRQLLHHAKAMFNRPAWMRVESDRLNELLAKVRDQLAMHFSLEEAYGYFDDAIIAAPHLSRRAEQLRAEHFELFTSLVAIVEEAEQLRYRKPREGEVSGLGERFFEFYAGLQEHESRESSLILEALNEDLGGGD